MPRVSVIIPCYNHGQYIGEAVQSVLNQTYQDFEIIIVNDGSTDADTNSILNNHSMPKTRVLNTTNQGLASARNNGIREARGKYILPLDADDKISSNYLEETVSILDNNQKVGIVYCEAQFFGEVNGKWELPEYSLDAMLQDNIIFCSGLFRKAEWERVGGYNPSLVDGWEDYDFWLCLIELGLLVYKVPKIMFYYRVSFNSMVRSKSIDQKVRAFVRIFNRHESLFVTNIGTLFQNLIEKREQLQANVAQKEQSIVELANTVHKLENTVHDLEATIDVLINSASWRVTAPLRTTRSYLGRFLGCRR